jgi:GDP/UDP-N,N'-diacetylbacillosamine 2-epimerase (hydrolysing)
MNRKICVITGARADYGLLRWVMQGIKDDSGLTLQVVATGMHLSPEFGLTYKVIELDGFKIDRKVEMLTSSDTPAGTAKSTGLGMLGFSDALSELNPDLILVLGDRFEIFSAVATALILRIPVAHLHGGESTEGAFDEAFRHSITKMAHLHFVAASEYKQRVIQLGEHPGCVFLVGGLGIDNIEQLQLLNLSDLEADLGFKFGKKNLLITFHPVTLESSSVVAQMQTLLTALDKLQDTQLIFTMPNADSDGRALIAMVESFTSRHANAHAFTSLGQLRYLSCIAQVDGVVGNSSSGILEVPSFKKGTINIGDRQRGRLQATSIINCEATLKSITDAINKLYSPNFQVDLSHTSNPYGKGGASEKIVNILKNINLKNIIRKTFYDLPNSDPVA